MKSLLTTGLLSLIAACQPLPMPFQPEISEKLQNKLTQPSKGLGLLVIPIRGINKKIAVRLAQLTAEELLKRKIIAYSGIKSVHSKIVFGRAIPKINASSTRYIHLTWYLAENIADGKPKKLTEMVLPSKELNNRSTRIRDIARFVSKQIARVEFRTNFTGKSTKNYQASVYVWPIIGEERFMGKHLQNQMRERLRNDYFQVPEKLVSGALVLLGTIAINDISTEIKQVLIDWSIMDQEGKELGKLHQSNKVTVSILQKKWPQLARNIAKEASTGLRTILNTVIAKTNSTAKENLE
tara:strand:+ start:2582 stop:3469 length:888 start_codon:yes stop_codon:yes gene_type:complete